MLNRNHALSVFDPFREIEKVEKSFFDDPWANFGRTFTDSFRHEFTVQIIKHRLRISTQITRFTRNRTIRILCFYPLATERIAVCKVIISTSVTS